MKKKIPNSVRKYIRREKARIRSEVLSLNKQKELISALLDKFYKKEVPSKKIIKKGGGKSEKPQQKKAKKEN